MLNATNLSFVGRTTLFQRVAQSPGQETKKASGKLEVKDNYKMNNNSMIDGNNLSTTINSNNMSKTTKVTNNTFRDAVQRGVLSGIGFLKR